MFDEYYQKLLKEFSSDEEDISNIRDLLKNQYKSRRVLLTDEEFSLKTFDTQRYPNRPDISVVRSKPRGTWYSRGEDWVDWMSTEQPDWMERYKHAYWLDLDYTKILRINNDQKFLAFERKYGGVDGNGIDWQRVSSLYSGIEIIPYFWKFRMQHMWYYPWDIASGCVWDSSAIKGYTEIDIPQ
jgi:hypothetical protein